MASNSGDSLMLLDDLTTKDKRQCIETLIKIFRNVVQSNDPKFRKLRVSNKRFHDEVWKHEGSQVILLESGWILQDDFIVLPPEVDVTPMLAILLDNREVIPDKKEWVPETKQIIKNPEKAREEELRQKALEEKKKEMAKLKRDMAERKALSTRILAEHRNDQIEKRQTRPSIARPLGEGGSGRMKDLISNDEGG